MHRGGWEADWHASVAQPGVGGDGGRWRQHREEQGRGEARHFREAYVALAQHGKGASEGHTFGCQESQPACKSLLRRLAIFLSPPPAQGHGPGTLITTVPLINFIPEVSWTMVPHVVNRVLT